MSQQPVRRGIRPRTVVSLFALLAVGVLLMGCPDMALQPAYQRQQVPTRNYPAASVPITGAAKAWTEDQARNATNPQTGDQAVQAGNTLFAVNCAMCHGFDGKGTGKLAQYFPPKPADLTSPQVQQLRDGEIFWAITNGFGRMPAFRHPLTDDQRWQLVSYVRTLK